MPVKAILLHGDDLIMVDHTPGTAVAAGDVVVVGDETRIAHLDIPANTLGAVSAKGGVFTCVGNAAIAAGKKVYADQVANKVTETASTNKVFGVTVNACAGDNGKVNVRHDPGA